MSRHRIASAERGRRHREPYWFTHQWWSRGVAWMAVAFFVWLTVFAYVVERIMSVPVPPR